MLTLLNGLSCHELPGPDPVLEPQPFTQLQSWKGDITIPSDNSTRSREDKASPLGAPPADANSDGWLNQNLYFSAAFENQIKTQKTNVFISLGVTLGVLAVGLLAIWPVFRKMGLAGTSVEYMKLGPIALSGIALPFPLRMFLSCRLRIPIYRGFKRLFDEAAARGTHVDPNLVEDARAALKAVYYKLD